MILILGAGLTGLTTAFFLKDKNEYMVIEKENQAGGLCRSFKVKGFTFDYTGHLLHFKTRSAGNFVKKILGQNLKNNKRNAGINYKGRLIPYPFQANLYHLPHKETKECLIEFLKAQDKKIKIDSFEKWNLKHFGKSIYEKFMKPYNEKLYRSRLDRISPDFAENFIPCPDLKDIMDGALSKTRKRYGYNINFYYPLKGGIGCFTDSIKEKLKNIKTGVKISSINLKRKEVRIGHKTVKYDFLINTIPLPEFLKLIVNPGYIIKKNKKMLKYISVFNLNIGLKRKNKKLDSQKYHWLYFPGKKDIFYRVGFYNNITPYAVPGDNYYSIYTEISYRRPVQDKKRVRKRIINDLINNKIISKDDKIIAELPLDIKYGYVIFDKNYEKTTSDIFGYLEKNNVYSAGRYAEWKYLTMEDSIINAKKTADCINGFKK